MVVLKKIQSEVQSSWLKIKGNSLALYMIVLVLSPLTYCKYWTHAVK